MKIWYRVRELLIATLIAVATVQFMVATKSKNDPVVIALVYGALIAASASRRSGGCGRWPFRP